MVYKKSQKFIIKCFIWSGITRLIKIYKSSYVVFFNIFLIVKVTINSLFAIAL
mgnify:CR=1 FL=1